MFHRLYLYFFRLIGVFYLLIGEKNKNLRSIVWILLLGGFPIEIETKLVSLFHIALAIWNKLANLGLYFDRKYTYCFHVGFLIGKNYVTIHIFSIGNWPTVMSMRRFIQLETWIFGYWPIAMDYPSYQLAGFCRRGINVSRQLV